MTRLFAALAFAAAALAWWLTEQDRKSPVALDLVEWQARLPAPLWVLLLAVALAATVVHAIGRWSFRQRIAGGRAGAVAPVVRPASTAPPSRPLAMGNEPDWFAALAGRARRIQFQPGARLLFDTAVGVPFLLEVGNQSPEQARRSIDLFVTFLATVPEPPRARVNFLEAAPELGNRKHLVAGIARQHLPHGSFSLVEAGPGVDLLFPKPDPCWPLDRRIASAAR
jgi:hypothetical protein